MLNININAINEMYRNMTADQHDIKFLGNQYSNSTLFRSLKIEQIENEVRNTLVMYDQKVGTIEIIELVFNTKTFDTTLDWCYDYLDSTGFDVGNKGLNYYIYKTLTFDVMNELINNYAKF